MTETLKTNSVTLIKLGNDKVSLLICPEAGGKIVSIVLNEKKQELIWNNPNLELAAHKLGTQYDPNFFGGIDELLPNDEKEMIDGRPYPDHGELWTTALSHEVQGNGVTLRGKLDISGLNYEKRIQLEGQSGTIHVDYVIRNMRSTPNHFLWKLHAAMKVQQGDQIHCPAKRGEILNEEFSGRVGQKDFVWPLWKGDRLDIVQDSAANRNEFFYLTGLEKGEIRMESEKANTFFEYQFDKTVFPYAWVFATYGGWNSLYTAVLEPCTAIPLHLSQSIANNTCARLDAEQELRTRVTINVGRLTERVA